MIFPRSLFEIFKFKRLSSEIQLGIKLVLIVLAATCLIAIFSIYFMWCFPILNKESFSFIRNYNSSDSIIRQIFNVQLNDWGMYQARELSYLFDLIDARIIAYSNLIKKPIFFSSVHLISLFIISIFCTVSFGFKAKNKTAHFFLTIIFLLNVNILLYYYFRTAKILTGVMAVMLVAQSCSYFSKFKLKNGNMLWPKISIFVAAIVASVLDRQGFFICFSMGLVVFFYEITAISKYSFKNKISVLFFGAATVNCSYNFLIGPYLIKSILGYSVDFEFQKLPLRSLSLNNLLLAIESVFEQISHFFGGYHLGYLVFLFVYLELFFSWQKNGFKLRLVESQRFIVLNLSFLLAVVMYWLMLLKLPSSGGYEIFYCGIPLACLVFVFALYFINYFSLKYIYSRNCINILFLCVLAIKFSTVRKSLLLAQDLYLDDVSANLELRRCVREQSIDLSKFGFSSEQFELCYFFRNLRTGDGKHH